MRPCPYRAQHEFDADGLCRHCFAERPEEWRTTWFNFPRYYFSSPLPPAEEVLPIASDEE